MRRLKLGVLGLLFLSPWLLSDGTGNQPGLGLYLAFIGCPVGLTCLLFAIFNVQDPPGYFGPIDY